MAGAGYKLFNTGDVLLASEVNTYLMQQTVMSFADSAARTTALSSVLAEGMVSYLRDTNVVEIYNGSAWASLDDPNAIQNTIVDAKGDIVAASGSDTPARLAVGNNGETLVADSSTSTGLRYQASQAAGRNFVINGGMDIWQRGTSFNNPASAYYTADRFQGMRHSQVTGITVSRQTTSDTTNLPTIQYCARVSRDNANTSTNALYFGSVIETINSIPLAGQTVTMSFYARKGANYSPTSNALNVKLISGTGTDQNNTFTGNFTGSSDVISQTATLTATWQRFTYSATIGATATELQVLVYASPTGTAGAADYYEVTGFQLELGSVATTFSRAGGTIQGELAACQRYYWRALASTTYPNALFAPSGFTTSTTAFVANVQFPVEMRTQPTTIDFSTLRIQDSAASVFAASALAVSDQSTTFMMGFSGVIAGATAGRWCKVIGNNSSAAYLGFGAEL